MSYEWNSSSSNEIHPYQSGVIWQDCTFLGMIMLHSHHRSAIWPSPTSLGMFLIKSHHKGVISLDYTYLMQIY